MSSPASRDGVGSGGRCGATLADVPARSLAGYARTLAREPHTDIVHQLLAWLRLWS